MRSTPKQLLQSTKNFTESYNSIVENENLTEDGKTACFQSLFFVLEPNIKKIITACKKDLLSFFEGSTKENIYLNEDLKYLLFFSLRNNQYDLFKTLLEAAEKFTVREEYVLDKYSDSMTKREVAGKRIKIKNFREIESRKNKLYSSESNGYLSDRKRADLQKLADLQISNSFFGLINSSEEGKKNSLLHEAVKSHNLSFTDLLLNMGANVNCLNNFYKTPLNVAIESGNQYAAEIIMLTERKKIIPKIHILQFFQLRSPAAEHLSFLKELLLLVKDINEKFNPNFLSIKTDDGVSTSLLLEAVKKFVHPEIIKLLLARKPDLGQQYYCPDKIYSPDIVYSGYTALHFEAQKQYDGSLHIVKLLVEQGADLNAKDQNGNTPLHILTMTVYIAPSESKEIFKYLLENGADPFIKNNKGLNVFGVATKMGNYMILASETIEIEKAKRKYPEFKIDRNYFCAETPGYAHYIPIWYEKSRSSREKRKDVSHESFEEVLTEANEIGSPNNPPRKKLKLDDQLGL